MVLVTQSGQNQSVFIFEEENEIQEEPATPLSRLQLYRDFYSLGFSSQNENANIESPPSYPLFTRSFSETNIHEKIEEVFKRDLFTELHSVWTKTRSVCRDVFCGNTVESGVSEDLLNKIQKEDAITQTDSNYQLIYPKIRKFEKKWTKWRSDIRWYRVALCIILMVSFFSLSFPRYSFRTGAVCGSLAMAVGIIMYKKYFSFYEEQTKKFKDIQQKINQLSEAL